MVQDALYCSRGSLLGIGTFIRLKAIDKALLGICSQSQNMQIVVLGAGFDTRWHRLHDRLSHVSRYVELDFADVVRKKIDALGGTGPSRDPRYSLIPFDLTKAESLPNQLQDAHINPHHPLVFLLECCLMYMPKDRVALLQETLIGYCRDYCGFIIFDVLFRNDVFSTVMVENFSRRGIILDAITVKTKSDVLTTWNDLAPFKGSVQDLTELEASVYLDDLDRVALRVSLALDEYEEWTLIGQHYYFAVIHRIN